MFSNLQNEDIFGDNGVGFFSAFVISSRHVVGWREI